MNEREAMRRIVSDQGWINQPTAAELDRQCSRCAALAGLAWCAAALGWLAFFVAVFAF